MEYIEREAFQAALRKKKAGVANKRYTEGWNDCLMRIKSMVSNFPAADVAPVVYAHWERRYNSWRCANCGKEYKINFAALAASVHNYCPYCGAKMER